MPLNHFVKFYALSGNMILGCHTLTDPLFNQGVSGHSAPSAKTRYNTTQCYRDATIQSRGYAFHLALVVI